MLARAPARPALCWLLCGLWRAVSVEAIAANRAEGRAREGAAGGCPTLVRLRPRSQVDRVPPADFHGFDHGSAYQGLYVNPDAKLAFCLIEKNACTSWSATLGGLELPALSNNKPRFDLVSRTFSPRKAQAVFSRADTTRAVFVRDPLERFLSAFLDKCFEKGCSNPHCLPRNPSEAGSPVSFRRAVEWLQRQSPATVDGHFKPQARHCELYQRLPEYNVVVLMRPETLDKDAACVLEMANLTRLDIRGFSGHHEQHPQQGRLELTSDLLRKFYTPMAARKVMQFFREDYDLFGLPQPAWITEADGSLYDALPGTRNGLLYARQCGGPVPLRSASLLRDSLEPIEDVA